MKQCPYFLFLWRNWLKFIKWLNISHKVSKCHNHHMYSSLCRFEAYDQSTVVFSKASWFLYWDWNIWHVTLPQATDLWTDVIFTWKIWHVPPPWLPIYELMLSLTLRHSLQVSPGFSLWNSNFKPARYKQVCSEFPSSKGLRNLSLPIYYQPLHL